MEIVQGGDRIRIQVIGRKVNSGVPEELTRFIG